MHEQLRLTANHRRGAVRIGLEASAGGTHCTADDLLADGMALGLVGGKVLVLMSSDVTDVFWGILGTTLTC